MPPDFELKDTRGELVRLSGYTNRQPVVIVFNRGFI
jgi:peroxiredoxin